ncbi:MAG: phenylacetate--CoA ligase family protein [Terriglobales bacterium]
MFEQIPTLLENLILGRSIARRLQLARHVPRWLVERIQTSEFQDTVRWAGQRGRFYRTQFAARGINPRRLRTPADLGDFFTTSTDLRALPTEDFVCDKPEAGFETTGTTANNKRVYFSNEEVRDIGFEGAVGLWNLGLRPDDRVVDAFDYAFWNAGITLLHSLSAVGCFHVIGSKLPPEEFYRRIKEYRFNVLIVDTAWLVTFTEIAQREGTWPVKFILSGSENMSEQTRQWVQSVWSTRVYQAYGQTESLGATGIECPAQQGYHLNEFNFIFEIREPNEQGYGELVFTTLTRKVMPFIRYRTNDITRFLHEPCGCPLQSMRRVDKIVGRADEIISCGMGMISPWIFETWFAGVAGLADDWQIAVTQPETRDVLVLRLEVQPDAPPAAVLEQELLRRLEQRFPYYFKNFHMGMYDLRFEVLPRHTLRPAGPRRKLRRVVDERIPTAALAPEAG